MRTYLQITFHCGKPFVAYLYLPRRPGDRSATTREVAQGIIADLADDGRPIGLEILSPSTMTATAINAALVALGQPEVAVRDLGPLAA
jgi:hypothetical protein